MPSSRPDDWRALVEGLYSAARAIPGIQGLSVFSAICMFYGDAAKREMSERLASLAPVVVSTAEDRNIKPSEAAERLGISVRKLTRERFTTYRSICVPLAGQSRGYVVNARALDSLLVRQRER